MSDKLPLVKRRDLGDVIQDSIAFVSHRHTQVLWRSILLYVLPIYMVAGFFLGQFQIDVKEVTSAIEPHEINTIDELIDFFLQIVEIFSHISPFHYYMATAFSLISTTLMMAFTYNFVAAYHQSSSGNVDADELRSHTFADVLWILGFQILLGLITGICFLFFFIPGIYVGVLLSILMVVAKIENLSFANAFARCSELMRNNWFSTAIVVIVVWLMIFVISLTLNNLLQAIFLAIDKERGLVLAAVFQNALAGVLAVVSTVAICLQYFHLRAMAED